MKNEIRNLICGDTHEPVSHPGYLQFCIDVGKKYNCNVVTHIGDLVDWHAVSFYTAHPECPGAKDEYVLAKQAVNRWKKAFKDYDEKYICIGNHDERPERVGRSVHIPAELLKSYQDMWDMHDWQWGYEFWIDGIYYTHGTGTSGLHPAWTMAGKMGESVVIGHCHSRAGVKWRANPRRRFFAMDVGCGIDIRAWQFVYGRSLTDRPILACGVVIDGIPYHEIMPIEKYPRSKYERKRRHL